MPVKKKLGYAKYRLSPLKAITAAAKKLYATGRYAKWTDAVKAASKNIKPAAKKTVAKKAAPKKKAAVKKAVPKKAVQQKLFGTKKATGIASPKSALLATVKDDLGKTYVTQTMATTKRDKRAAGKKITELKAKLRAIQKL